MKTKLIALLLAMSMVLALTACGRKEEPAAPEAEAPEAETEAPETALPEEETAEEETEAPEEESSEEEAAPEEENEPVTEPLPEEKPESAPRPQPEEKPETPAVPEEKPEAPAVPEEKPEAPAAPEEKPDETPATGVDLMAYYESVASTITDWPAMMMAEGEALDAFYPGLSGIAAKQCMVFMPMMSAVACEIALVEVENAADVQAVKDIFQARISYQVGDENNPGGAWYPESIEGWKNNSRIVANGNCVMMVAFSECETFVSQFNALFA